jgi:predicted helicase
VSNYEFWGTRLEKYKQAAGTQLNDVAWEDVQCFTPYHMLRPLDWADWDNYQHGWSIADSLNPLGGKAQIFDLSVLGFQSHRDHFAIAFDRSDIEVRAREMIDSTLADRRLAEKYGLKNNRDWDISEARKALQADKDWQKKVIRCAYRPFDNRHCFLALNSWIIPAASFSIMLPVEITFNWWCLGKLARKIGATHLSQVDLQMIVLSQTNRARRIKCSRCGDSVKRETGRRI